MSHEEYTQGILKWRQEVDANLRRENGWLALAGLFWLRQGANRIGSAPGSDILLPASAPEWLGTFDFDGTHVTLQVEADLPVEVNGVATRSAVLDTDQEDVPSFITLNNMRMVVLRRSKGVGIRVWDNSRKERQLFPERQWYPSKEALRVPATYAHFETPRVVKMPDVLGAVLDQPMQGFVSFELQGKKHEIIVEELPDRRLFVQFMDLTNNHGTYPSGRYHYTEPHRDGTVFVDFNKAYSPPCAFTEYATCTFPPQENRMDIAIEAGELYPGNQ